MKTIIVVITLLIIITSARCVHAQGKYDSLIYTKDSVSTRRVMCYSVQDEVFIYKRPAPFSFITQLPKTLYYSARTTFRKESIPAASIIAGSTILLIAFDHHITDGVQQFGRSINLDPQTRYRTLVHFKLGKSDIPIYELPKNLNSAIYSLGEGFTSVVVSGAFLTFGKIKNDYRAAQTASQIIQVQFAVGVLTQTFKRIAGRESPKVATAEGGEWDPLPSFAAFRDHRSTYDAFPSGHLATMMGTVTVIAMNYPEVRWVKPVGYSLIGLVGLAMINNGVHWAGDYPLALGIGYVTGHATVRLNRWVRNEKRAR